MKFELGDYGFSWVARSRLSSWAGYLDRSGAYGGEGGVVPSDGSVDIVFAPEGRDAHPLTDRERALIQWFIDHERIVSEAVKAAIFHEYPRLQEQYGYSPAERVQCMPDISSPEELKPLVGLHSVNVHQIEKGEAPYLGFEFGCTWDDEHGLGVLVHGTRVVEVGGADRAILLWIAKRDASVN
jgi:hypothetical protein